MTTRTPWLLPFLLAACAAPVASAPPSVASTTDGAVADVATTDDVPEDASTGELASAEPAPDADKPWPKGLHGKKPDAPVALPAFSQVVDSSGAGVSPDDLKGHWSVLWFYPMASTGG
jgi:hypothetical protein